MLTRSFLSDSCQLPDESTRWSCCHVNPVTLQLCHDDISWLGGLLCTLVSQFLDGFYSLHWRRTESGWRFTPSVVVFAQTCWQSSWGTLRSQGQGLILYLTFKTGGHWKNVMFVDSEWRFKHVLYCVVICVCTRHVSKQAYISSFI